MANLNVNLGSASYTIHIKADQLNILGQLLATMDLSNHALVITDNNVQSLYGNKILTELQSAGFTVGIYSINPGEQSKSSDEAMAIYTKAIELKLDRKSPIIALGGGVVGDLAGFVAATYLRGVPFIQVPTSLLAQVDSSVGGKVAVNHPLGKNLIGAFYQPKLVFIDTQLLSTLPERELYTGLAEVIKYGIIADREFFTYLIKNHEALLNRENDAVTNIISRSCSIKADVVGKDEHETGMRAILNFGHTIGHAIEAYTGYKKYNHGEAVAIGMHGAVLISYQLGLCSKQTVDEVRTAISIFKLPLKAEDCPAEAILPLLTRDKKAVNGKINWVLLNAIGEVLIVNDVSEAVIRKALLEIT